MTALDEFYEAYLHYSVSQRLFEDRCRQLTECTGTVTERQALVDETLRLAMCVTNNVIDLEPLLSEAADELRNDGGDRDLLKALSLISNSVREDRDRADSYTLFVTARRSGNTVRRPRKPRVANPFVYVEELEDEEEEAVTPAPAHVPAGEKPKPVVPVEEPEVQEDPIEEDEEETEDEIAEESEEEPTSDVVPEPNEDPVETEEEEPAPVEGPVPPAPDDRSIDEDPVEDESEKPEDTAEDEEISDEPEDPSEDNESRSFLDSIRDFFGRILKR